MTDISLTAPSAYDPRMVAIARQQKLADMLSQMGAQEIPVSSAGGISAPISPMSALAKGLASFGGSYLSSRAEKDAADYYNSSQNEAGRAAFVQAGGKASDYVPLSTGADSSPDLVTRAGSWVHDLFNGPSPSAPDAPQSSAQTIGPYVDPGATPRQVADTAPSLDFASQPSNAPAGMFAPATAPSDIAQIAPTPASAPTATMPAAPSADPYIARMTARNNDLRANAPTTGPGRAATQQAIMENTTSLQNYVQQRPVADAMMKQIDPALQPSVQAMLNNGKVDEAITFMQSKGISAPMSATEKLNENDVQNYMTEHNVSRAAAISAIAANKGADLVKAETPGLVDRAARTKAGEWDSTKKEIDYRTQKQIEAFHEKYDLPPEDMALIDAAVDSKRIDFSKLNSRTARYYAQLLEIDPNADLTSNAGVAALKKSPLFQQKVMVAATIPQMLTNLENITNKLNYNDIKAVGGIQNWWKQQNNDPTLAEYGPLRSDLILKITSAMRGVGMSDKATELENVVNSSTMSPQAIAGYVRGQMASIKPMLQEFAPVTAQTGAYENIEGMNVTRGTKMPGSPAQGGAAAPGAGGGYASKDAAETDLKAKGHKPGDSVQVTINGQTGTLVLH